MVGLQRRLRKRWLGVVPLRDTTCIVLDCNNFADCLIDLGKVSDSQQEQLFLVLSRHISQDLFAPEVLYLQVQALYGNSTAKIEDFTNIWAEEFSRRFELANHVALETGYILGNGRYTIRLLIGTRINSSVYLASDISGGSVVVKELVIPVNTEAAVEQKLLEQFEREAGILARLDHGGIAKVIDHFVENGRSYLVMACAPGVNLREYVRLNAKLTESETLGIARQLVDVLEYLHGREPAVLHRDFTPDNLVYSAVDQRVKVVDFGAVNLYATKGTATLVGKQGYMPPEQFKGKPSPASDVYALGSTLLFLLTGEDPRGMGHVPPALSGLVSAALRELIEDCLKFDQEDRPSASKLVQRLALL